MVDSATEGMQHVDIGSAKDRTATQEFELTKVVARSIIALQGLDRDKPDTFEQALTNRAAPSDGKLSVKDKRVISIITSETEALLKDPVINQLNEEKKAEKIDQHFRLTFKDAGLGEEYASFKQRLKENAERQQVTQASAPTRNRN